MSKLYILILLFLNATNLFGAEGLIPKSKCSNIDVRNKLSLELRRHFSTPRNQDSIGWCYGFTAADLLSVEVGKPISSTHISALFNKNANSNIFIKLGYEAGKPFRSDLSFEKVYEGGFTGTALKYASNEKYICPESALPFDLNHYGETVDIIQRLEKVKRSLSDRNGHHKHACLTIKSIQMNMFKNMGLLEIQLILESNNMNQALAKLINKNCKGKLIAVGDLDVKILKRPTHRPSRDVSLSKTLRKFKKEQEEYFGLISRTLSSGRPMSVSYDVSKVTDSDGGHASILLAREWRNGKCQFKLRNTWGKHCAPYDNKEIEGCNESEGAYWVSDKKFFDMARRIDYISK